MKKKFEDTDLYQALLITFALMNAGTAVGIVLGVFLLAVTNNTPEVTP